MIEHMPLSIDTPGRGTLEITSRVNHLIANSLLINGLCHLFVQHTSASLILCENADATVRDDLETVFGRLAPDGDPAYRHRNEGPDDMAAHARTILTHSSLSIPFSQGRMMLGTWQGLYLWEHREMPHQRRIVITLNGE